MGCVRKGDRMGSGNNIRAEKGQLEEMDRIVRGN